MRVRCYVDSDLDEVVRLSMALFPHPDRAAHARDIQDFVRREDGAMFVIERPNGKLAGYVEAGTRPYADGCESSPVGYVEAWYVDEDVRRSGWGRSLLLAAEEWARSKGYHEMASDALLDNVASHKAHEHSGYVEVDRVVQFRKPLYGGKD